ncbi:MAG: hypothetical protein JW806_08750 [Sedimentisphaerales bacterium]|nr:hypothetical protein [Sedimentisphaerales bacterium]
MRVLLFSFLILTTASIASAEVHIYITDVAGNSEITLAPSETVELLIWYTGDPIISFDLEIGVTSGSGTLSDPAITAVGRNQMYDIIVCYLGFCELGAAGDSGQLGSGIAQPLANIQFHCDGTGDVTIDMTDIYTLDPTWGQVMPIMHGMTIHQEQAQDPNCLYVGQVFSVACNPTVNLTVSQAMIDKWEYLGRPLCWCCDGQKCGDCNGDGRVDTQDLACVKFYWYKSYTQTGYNPCGDFNMSGRIDTTELANLKAHWFKTANIDPCPPLP